MRLVSVQHTYLYANIKFFLLCFIAIPLVPGFFLSMEIFLDPPPKKTVFSLYFSAFCGFLRSRHHIRSGHKCALTPLN